MAVIEGGTSGSLAETGVPIGVNGSDRALHVNVKPIAYGALGHYRVNHRLGLVAAQAANSRLFEVRNSHASNLIIPTRLQIKWIQNAAHTAQIEDSIDTYRVTGFTAVDTTTTATPVPSVKRSTMAAAPGAAQIRGLNGSGSAGMTGGTLTKDSSSIGQLPQVLQAAVPTAGQVLATVLDVFDDVNGTHPFVLAQNEGILIENRALLGAAAGSVVYIDFSWAEVAAF